MRKLSLYCERAPDSLTEHQVAISLLNINLCIKQSITINEKFLNDNNLS